MPDRVAPYRATVISPIRRRSVQVAYESYPRNAKTYEKRDGFFWIPAWLRRRRNLRLAPQSLTLTAVV